MDRTEDRIKGFWKDRAERIDDPVIAARFRMDDRLQYDLALSRKYCDTQSRVLDLGAGTCELSYHLAPYVHEVVAVDFIDKLLCKRSLPSNITTVVSDIRTFESDSKFDTILLFGVLNYVTDDKDILAMYQKINTLLLPGGTLIIKHQSGVEDTVRVDNYSDEFGTRYISIYRHIDEELRLLSQFFDVEVLDAYPPHLNRWENTHFYGYICKPKASVRPMELCEAAA